MTETWASKKKSGDISWTAAEFSKVTLQDKRLNMRCQKIASDLEQQPTDPIHQACEDWADAKAGYRFFDNSKGMPDQIISAHSGRTVKRMKAHALALAIQDTTLIF